MRFGNFKVKIYRQRGVAPHLGDTNIPITYFDTIEDVYDYVLDYEIDKNNCHLNIDEIEPFLFKKRRFLIIDGMFKQFCISHVNYPNDPIDYTHDNDGNEI